MGRKIVGIYFNPDAESNLLKFAENQKNFSKFVKDCIKEKMDPRQLISPEIERAIKQMMEKQFANYATCSHVQDVGLKGDIEDYF